jgi:hypothetical protein
VWTSIAAFLKAPTNVGAFLAIGIVAALVAIWGVTTQRAIARRRATLDHIARSLSDRDLIQAHLRFIQLAKEPGGLAPWADVDKEKSEETQTIKTVLNEFELIAIGIQRGIIDYQLYVRWFRTGAILYWRHGAPFVHALRARVQNDAVFHEFEEMVRWFRENKMPRRGMWIGRWF